MKKETKTKIKIEVVKALVLLAIIASIILMAGLVELLVNIVTMQGIMKTVYLLTFISVFYIIKNLNN